MPSVAPLIDRALNHLTRVIELVLALAFIVGVSINFINVMGRYLFGYTYLGADEVQIYIMIWMAFLGAAVVTWRNQHLRMDVFFRCLPSEAQELVTIFTGMVFIVVSFFVTAESVLYTMRVFTLGQTSDMAHLPMWIPHGAILLGFAMMAFMTLYAGIKLLVSKIKSMRTAGGGS